MQLRRLAVRTLAVLLLFQPLLYAQSAPGFRFHSGAATNPLPGFFTHFWKLADVNDSIGSLNFTNVNTATFSAGHIGNALTLVRTSAQALTHADDAGLRFSGGNWTVAVWFNRTNTTGLQEIACKRDATDSSGAFRIAGTSSAETFAILAYGGTGTTVVAQFTGIAASNNNWHLVVAWWDTTVGASGTLYYSLDGGATQSTAATGVIVDSGAKPFNVGATSNGTNAFNGQIDAMGWALGKIPTPAQITALWAGGAGWEP